ncbi:helix-turn-helix transcriptional regulator [Parvibaculum sp.]|uniref:ArsR/SmtB family transcription factor n=1 Tax=Parvibaculum sp. TaxID=2024848 RepID=UPI002730DCEA|nr:metalloregulator ArsR/SmtB family transcription factor [Parvibaculum sp.]MDP1628487.1 metalloregulator ArsR/SmtB family transcription factor [Parvibaculum sp.]MDP2151819.1 metalloregulator ArsR/SmtB family transcription factor [Parvibaculum sp.]MDP3326942.1 metalloregulator ArsR/SmtB family transcription factor [Parvibaculum sp.]
MSARNTALKAAPKKSADLDRTAQCLEALGQPVRLAVYRSLVRAGPEGRSVGELQEMLEIPRSTLSFHLRRLIEVGLVVQERHGTTLICHADMRVMDATLGFLMRECCADRRRPG